MLLANPSVESYRVDEGVSVFSKEHKSSESDLEDRLNELRGNKRCAFCENENTTVSDPDLVVPGTGGTTCRKIIVMATAEVNGTDICVTLQKEERVCCPSPRA